MALDCDVCGQTVADGVRFCPGCGMEFLSERERPSRPSVPTQDVFEWDEPPEEDAGPREYTVSARQRPAVAAEQLNRTLQQAETRFAEGYVREAAATLREIRLHLAEHASLRPAFDRLHQNIVSKKRTLRERALDMAAEVRINGLLALLAGPATNLMEPEEICSIALTAAQSLYDDHHGDEAGELLRLSGFKTLRDPSLVRRHRELEVIVARRRHWQHWRHSATLFGGVSIAGAVVLVIWAWFIWQMELGRARGIVILLMIAGAVFLLCLPQLRPLVQKKLREFFEEKGPKERLAEFWKKWRGPR